MITKGCPKCHQHVAVASKSCKCGHSFFNSRRIRRGKTPENDEICRRTSRVKRDKPNYYDSQEYEKRKKRLKKARQEAIVVEKPSVVELNHISNISKETTAVRAKRRRQRKEEENGGGDLVAK